MRILTEDLKHKIAFSDHPEEYLILEEGDIQGQWVVQSLGSIWVLDFKDLIGDHRSVSPSALKEFLVRCEDLSYKPVFAEDPTEIMEAYDHLNDAPSVLLNSDLPGTVQGFLPYQLQGFNFLKDLDAGVALWSTGTGKSVLASALIKYHLDLSDFDLCWVVVKSHNKINMQRAFKRLTDIDALILDGPQKRRQELLMSLAEAPAGSVVITNYEKFRVDQDLLLPLFEKRVLLLWDEMPTKLKSRQTQLYKSVRKCLYRKMDLKDQRPESLRQYMLSATPIENGPEDFFNCSRLLDPGVYGTINEFRDEFVKSYSPFGHQPATWENLDKMGQKAAFMTHQVDKSDSDIASQFPEIIEEPYYIDWHKEDRAVYNLLVHEAKRKLEDRTFSESAILGLIGVMEMMCCAPSMISNSAALRRDFENGLVPFKQGSEVAAQLQEILTRKLTDDNHTKLETLRHLLCEDHPDEKVVIFSSYNDALLPILEKHLMKWNVVYVKYGGTQEEKQIAQDYFQQDDTVQVFLSSDQGSDSISLEEASVVIHYNLPWKWSTKIQRQNRAHRITSTHKHVRFYTLMMADSVEERKEKLIAKKQSFHQQVFEGEIAEQSESSRMTRDDLLYILGGQ